MTGLSDLHQNSLLWPKIWQQSSAASDIAPSHSCVREGKRERREGEERVVIREGKTARGSKGR